MLSRSWLSLPRTTSRPGDTRQSFLASQKYIFSVLPNSQLFITMCVKERYVHLREGRIQSLLEAQVYFLDNLNFAVSLLFARRE